MATSGWIEDRWLKKRKDPVTGKRERTELWGSKTKRYRVCGIPGVRRRSFGTLEEAKEWKSTAIVAVKKREFIDDREGEMLLGDYITEEWWPKRDDPVNTAGPMKSKIFTHIVDSQLGRTPMNVIDDGHLVDWKRELKGRGLADSTIEVIWNHLSSVFKGAVGKRIVRNPCQVAEKGVRPTVADGTKARAWTKSEAQAIRAGFSRRYQIVPDLGMFSGQRQAECFGFSPDDVDRELMLVRVQRQLLWENGTHPFYKLPKGNKQREVPLSQWLLDLIDAHVEEFPPVKVTLPWKGPGNGGRAEATVPLLVTTWFGNRLNPGDFNNRRMKPALVAAGLIAPREEGKRWEASRDMMHHRWRHLYASVQLGAGEDPISVSHWMGHASPDITFKIYAHFMPDRGVRGRTAMDNWLDDGTRQRQPAPDLWKVEPVAFREVEILSLPAERTAGPTELYVSAARYSGGVWAVGAQLDAKGACVGEIRTEHVVDPDRALASGLAWVQEYCRNSGLAVAQAENLNDRFEDAVRPYQALGRLLLVPHEGVM